MSLSQQPLGCCFEGSVNAARDGFLWRWVSELSWDITRTCFIYSWCPLCYLLMFARGPCEPLSCTSSLGDFQYLHTTSHFFVWVQHDTQRTGNSNFLFGTFWNFPSWFRSLVVWIRGCGIWGGVLGKELLIERHTSAHPRKTLRLFSMFRKKVIDL